MDQRSLLIIKLLLESEASLTISIFIDELGLSERTIYKELNNVKAELRKYHISLRSESKQGFRLEGSVQDIADLTEYIKSNRVDSDWNAKNRIDMLCLSLLSEKEYTKAIALSIALQVSVATIHNDLKVLGKGLSLDVDGLSLISKMGEGYLIDGDPAKSFARATHIFMEYIDDSTFYGLFQKRKDYPNLMITRIMKEFGYLTILFRLHEQMSDIIATGFTLLSDIQLKQFIIELMMFIKFHIIGKNLMGTLSVNAVNDKTKVFTALIKESIEKNFDIQFSHREIDYLLEIVQRYCRVSVTNQTADTRWYYVNKTRELVMLFERKMKVTLHIDHDFHDMLVEHLFGVASRIKDAVSIKNPLLQDVQENYSSVLNEVAQCLKVVFPDIVYSKDEVSFIALYFIAAIEKSTHRTLDALIICSSGMGSSKMLESRLEKELPEINVKKTISLMVLEQEDLSVYDFIFSTVPLELKRYPYLIVNPLLLDKEIIKIRNLIRNKQPSKKSYGKFYSTILENNHKDTTSELVEMIQVLEFGQNLIDHICVVSNENSVFHSEAIKDKLIEIGFSLKTDGFILNECMVIPKTRIGFLELELIDGEIPSLVIFLSKESYQANNMEAVIVMLYSKSVNEFMMDILSIIFETITQELKFILKRMDYEELMKKTIEVSVKKYLYHNYCKEISNG